MSGWRAGEVPDSWLYGVEVIVRKRRDNHIGHQIAVISGTSRSLGRLGDDPYFCGLMFATLMEPS